LKLLFRVILDVINPSFVVEDRQWQPSATIIFYNYFTALWNDPQVFILLDNDCLQSLRFLTGRSENCGGYLVANTASPPLRSHNKLLERSPVQGIDVRTCEACQLPHTSSFSISCLERYVPFWSYVYPTISPPVLSWDVIVKILSEEDYISDREDIKNESAYAHMVGFLRTYSGPEHLIL
jgi:hypothetical protein